MPANKSSYNPYFYILHTHVYIKLTDAERKWPNALITRRLFTIFPPDTCSLFILLINWAQQPRAAGNVFLGCHEMRNNRLSDIYKREKDALMVYLTDGSANYCLLMSMMLFQTGLFCMHGNWRASSTWISPLNLFEEPFRKLMSAYLPWICYFFLQISH